MSGQSIIDSLIAAEYHLCDMTNDLRNIFGMLDITTLEGTDHPGSVRQLCLKALQYRDPVQSVPSVAAICVYPVFARLVSGLLEGSGIFTACVAGMFPSGQAPLHLRVEEAQYALDNGAEEIDMVISRGRLLEGDEEYIRTEVKAFTRLCAGRARVKVILETGELQQEGHIRRAARIALEEGADFLKTSTGKISPGATLEAFYYMLDEIRIFHQETGEKRGIKAAGGIAEPSDALNYYLLTSAVLGKSWLDKTLFRFGASRLTEKLYLKIIQP